MSPLYCHEAGCPSTPEPACIDQVRRRVEKTGYKDGFDPDTAADLADDVVVGVLRALRRGSQIQNLWAYSVTIYRHRKADLFERKARSVETVPLGLSIEELELASTEDEVSTDDLIPSVSHSPQAIANIVRVAEMYGFTESELLTLGYFLYGFSPSEMAREESIKTERHVTPLATQQRMSRMKKRLRSVISEARSHGF